MEQFITIKELIKMGYFRNEEFISGFNGIENIATNITVLETPDGMSWLKGGEIVLTAGYAFINNMENRNNIIKIAYEKKAAAICIKKGRFFGEIENKLINDSNKFSIPIFVLDENINYSDIESKFYEILYNKKTANLLKTNEAYNELLNLQLKNSNIDDIVNKVSTLIGKKVKFIREIFTSDNNLNNYYFFKSRTENGGVLLIEELSNLNEFEIKCCKYAISLIDKLLDLEQIYLLSKSENHKLMTDLILNNLSIDPYFYYNVKTYLKWKSNKFFCIYFKWENKDNSFSRLRKFIELIYNGEFLFSKDDLGMFIYMNIEREDLRLLIDKIIKYFENKNEFLKIGISNEKNNFSEFRIAYLESKNICENTIERVSFISEYKSKEIFLKITNSRLVDKEIEDILYKIVNYDNKNNSELLSTLKKYIENDLKNKETSKQLHIHVETLRYRLKKLEYITGLNFNNSLDLTVFILVSNYSKLM